METKHTPGPWIEAGRFIYTKGQYGRTICEMQGSGGRYVERQEMSLSDEHFHEICANARLIAAAPDLLGTLQLAGIFIASVKRQLGDEFTGADEAMRVQVNEALAKAVQS